MMHRHHQTPQPSAHASGAIPYSKWTQHRAENGLIYLSHPTTHEVKWLWSRHRDPQTKRDYLVNTITGERHWVTPENQHLCPVKLDSSKASSDSPAPNLNPHRNSDIRNQQYPQRDPRQPQAQSLSQEAQARHQLLQEPGQRSQHQQKFQQHTLPDVKQKQQDWHEKQMHMQQDTQKRQHAPSHNMADGKPQQSKLFANGGHNYGSGWPSRARVQPGATSTFAANRREEGMSNPQQLLSHNTEGRQDKEKAAQLNGASLGLNDDEVLMIVPDSGRRYIYNQRTKKSRWLGGDPIGEFPNLTKPIQDSNSPKANHSTSASAKTDKNDSPKFPKVKLSTVTGNPGEQENDGNRKHELPSENGEVPDTAAADVVYTKLKTLNELLENVEQITGSGKFDMRVFRQIADTHGERSGAEDSTQEVAQRLLELAEYLTQQMLKVDAVESDGNAMIRGKRKEVVKKILALTDEVEKLRSLIKH